MKVLFIAWQDPETRRWIPVGRLTHGNGSFRFEYTRGAKESPNFEPFGWMRNLNFAYESEKLFPLFANRILPKSRPEYGDYLRWLGLNESESNELEVLGRSGGVRETDTLEIFPCPEPDRNHNYVGYFFSHGLRHLTRENQTRAKTLNPDERLYLIRDVQNEVDPTALLLRTENPIAFVGYCPRYLSSEFCKLIEQSGTRQVRVSVERVNVDAPSELTVLCKIVAPWPKGFSPCSRGSFRVLKKMSDAEKKRRRTKIWSKLSLRPETT